MSESPAERGIVVGVDGSPESHAAVRWAAQEAVLRRRPVTLLHVVAPIVVTWPIEPVITGFYEWQEDNATEVLKQSQETLHSEVEGSPSPEVHLELRHDGIMTELSSASESADMIVVGSRGLGPVGGAVLG